MLETVNPLPLIGEEAPPFEAETTQGRINFPGDYNRNLNLRIVQSVLRRWRRDGRSLFRGLVARQESKALQHCQP